MLTLDQALDLLFPGPSTLSEKAAEDEKKGQQALELIIKTFKNSTDSNEVADAAQASYSLALFILKKELPENKHDETKALPVTSSSKSYNILNKLFGKSVTTQQEQAIDLLKQAVELGGGEIYSEALLLLALIYKKQNKTDLSRAYLLWAASTGNPKACELWQEETQKPSSDRLQYKVKDKTKDKPETKQESKTDETLPKLRPLLGSIRPMQRIYLAVRRIRMRLSALTRFKKNHLGDILRDILGGETLSSEDSVIAKKFNAQIEILEKEFNQAIQEKLIEQSSTAHEKAQKITIPKPVSFSYLKDVLGHKIPRVTAAAVALLAQEPDHRQLTLEMGNIGIKFYYLARWVTQRPAESDVKKESEQAKIATFEQIIEQKVAPPTAPATELEARDLIKRGEAHYRSGIKREIIALDNGKADIDLARSCFIKAIHFRPMEAFFNLGVLHENKWRLENKSKESAPKTLDTAIRYYKKASDLGCAEASIALSEIYAMLYDQTKHVAHATAVYNYYSLARRQGYKGLQKPITAINEIFQKQSTDRSATKTEEKKEISSGLQDKVYQRKKESTEDAKKGLPMATLTTLSPETKDKCPKDADEKALVMSLFGERAVGFFSGWSKDSKEQKSVKLEAYIRHAQGQSWFYSGNSSYRSIQALFKKLGVLGDIRKKVGDEWVDPGNIASKLLVSWWEQNQNEKNQEENTVLSKLFNQHKTYGNLALGSGWSRADKQKATLTSFIAYARRGAWLYSGNTSHYAFMAYVKENKLDIADIRTRPATTTDADIAEELMTEVRYHGLLKK